MRVELRGPDNCPPEWVTLTAATTDFAVSGRWLETMGPLLPGQPRWLIGSVDGSPQVGLHARLLETAPAEPRYDIGAVLRGEIPAFEPRSVPLSAFEPETLYPALLFVLPGYTYAPAGPGAADPAVLGRTVEAVHDWARRHGIRSVSFLYVPERQRILRQALTEFGARPVQLYPTCVRPVDFADLDEYLGRLTRQRGRDLRRLLRRIDENGMVLGEDELSKVRDEVLELRLGLLRKYDSAADRATQAATLDRMIRNYQPEDRVVTTVRRDGRVVGFTLSLRHGDSLRVLWCGHEPDVYGTYFVMLFYELVAAALRRGINEIDYGTLKWQEKISFGCRLEQLAGYTWTL
ncbi:GNAT family N-acetyltransferase [Nocardia pseudovaccinii]|uniref:GNAT family N-acetyltransferase n=1 Tax=Nocardia pseudovaccinii TaxID=189540 RepID=UPI0007A43660|nr:GNAT family N-acetyltransferase [Nocardia pseudovaccinii]